MATQKPLILIVGATGTTGKIITNALLASGNFVRAPIHMITEVHIPRTDLILVCARI